MESPQGGESNKPLQITINHELKIKNNNNGFSNSIERKFSSNGFSNSINSPTTIFQPHEDFPKPEPPPGIGIAAADVSIPATDRSRSRSLSLPETLEKFIRTAVTKRISSFRNDDVEEFVTEFNLLGLKVTKSLKETSNFELKGRVSFFSRSNCRDCGAVRSFLRERGLNFVEINVDVYPGREKELVKRTGGSSSVPQIFFNEKLIGGLVALNSLRNSGMLDKKMEEMLGVKCPDDAPEPPVYGFDEAEVEVVDEMAEVVRVVRKKVPIQDRISKMKIVKNCFSGADLVEAVIHHFDCGRKKAVEIGKQLARKHFIHHVFGENQFEDGKHLYRFKEHESYIPKCHNFRGSVINDCEPKAAGAVSRRLASLMWAILESYASDDRRHLDYIGISNSEEFRRYVNLVEDLQRIDLLTLSSEEKLAFFLNLYNSMAIHAVIRIGHPGGMMDRRSFFSEFMYVVGGHPYSLSSILNGILRSNKRPPFSLIKPFGGGDKRLELSLPKVNPLIHFGISSATTGSPLVRFFTPNGVESELRYAAREFFQREDAMRVDLANRTVYLSKILKWYSADFGNENEILKWMMNYLDASKAGLLTHLLSDGGSINIVYHNFDWSINS